MGTAMLISDNRVFLINIISILGHIQQWIVTTNKLKIYFRISNDFKFFLIMFIINIS